MNIPDQSLTNQSALVPPSDSRQVVLQSAIHLWSKSRTSESVVRRDELIKKKCDAVAAFFQLVGKSPGEVDELDVERWLERLREQRLKPATVYARVSFLSSFYRWAMHDPQIGAQIRTNPVLLARPKAPRAYQTDSTKAWSDEELQAIVTAIEKRAAGSDTVGKRDLALLRMYMATGRRREEIISLRGRDVRLIEDGLEVGGRVKGGRYRTMKVEDPEVKVALIDYLTVAKRLHVLKTDAPLWTRHDHPKFAGEPLTSYAFVKNLKRYARDAGVGEVHLHQTRHTFARIVQEETGSFNETQEALDHENLATTRVYVQRIAVKADKHSRKIGERMKSRGTSTT
ncbi:MAG: tyrosine-type recombinase/integrase [Acidobacteriota bacterium]|nr:tyrosine-type recombinase/integrase [Acidobacteriota bacterium]